MALLLVIGQTAAIYLFLVVLLARTGRALLAGLTPVGYLAIALLGSAVETGLYRGSTSLWAGLASAATLVVADHLITLLMNRWPRLRRWIVGVPVVLIHHGRVIPEYLRLVRLSVHDLEAAVRKHGYASLDDVRLVVLEIDGSIGVVPRERTDERPSPGGCQP